MRGAKPKAPFQCLTCLVVFGKRKELNRHAKSLNHGCVACPAGCGLVFSTRKLLRQHIAEHRGDVFVFFPKQISQRGQEQAYSEHTTPQSPWSCVPCKQSFGSEVELQQHYIKGTSHPKCWICQHAFRDVIDMLLHIKTEHPGSPPYPTRPVNLSVLSLTDVDSATITSTEFKCNPCERFYSSNDALQEHFRSYHPTCGVCDIGFQYEEDYEAHALIEHIPPALNLFGVLDKGAQIARNPDHHSLSGVSAIGVLNDQRPVSCPPRITTLAFDMDETETNCVSADQSPIPSFTRPEIVADDPCKATARERPPRHSDFEKSHGDTWLHPGPDVETPLDTPTINPIEQPSSKNTSASSATTSITPPFAKCYTCCKEPQDPTVTMCGHLFCNACIIEALRVSLRCPKCDKALLVGLSL